MSEKEIVIQLSGLVKKFPVGASYFTALNGINLNIRRGGFLDNVSAMVFYDWRNQQFYNFINWQHQLNSLTLYTIAYWNPKKITIPSQMGGVSRFSGKGIQLILTWHH